MAGGVGSRLGAITKHKPKPAIEINGKPFIYYTMDWLRENGFKEFIFLLSYKSEIIEEVILNYAKDKSIKCEFYLDKERLGTLNAIINIQEKLNKVFFYTNADEISNISIQSMYLRFLESKASVVSLLKKDKDGYLNINEEAVTEKLLAGNGTHIELGCKFINKEIFQFLEQNYEKFEDFLYDDLINKTKLCYYISESLPIRIDKASDIKKTNAILKNNLVSNSK